MKTKKVVMITNICSIMIFVNNQQESLNFWVEKLGFKVMRDIEFDSKTRWIELASPDSNVPSLILYPKSSITVRKSRPLPVIIFRIENIRMTLEQMRKIGVIISHNQLESCLGSYTTFTDNEGNEYIILEKLEG